MSGFPFVDVFGLSSECWLGVYICRILFFVIFFLNIVPFNDQPVFRASSCWPFICCFFFFDFPVRGCRLAARGAVAPMIAVSSFVVGALLLVGPTVALCLLQPV